MTREEAIRFLENISIYQQPNSNYRNALDVAIEALSAEPYEECVSKEQLLRELNAQVAVNAITKETAQDMLEHLSSIQPKTGHWIIYGRGYEKSYECDNCKKESLECGNYCPNCGCRMVSHKKGVSKHDKRRSVTTNS